jgi:disulfide bond formation protein DsbB
MPSKIPLSRRPLFWLGVAGFGVALEAVALFYQHVLNYWPCVLCIHVRMWVALMVVLALVAAASCRLRPARATLLVSVTAVVAALLERAWQLLGTERGWIIGSCEMVSGLPEWVPLERWLPWLFQIQEPCGYTPDMPWGLTMAESLLGLFAVMLVFMLALLPGAARSGSD